MKSRKEKEGNFLKIIFEGRKREEQGRGGRKLVHLASAQ